MRSVMVLAGLGILVVGAIAQPQPSPLGIVPQPVPGLSVAIWMEKAQYYVGESARFFVYLSQPAYLYVFDIEPTGHIRLIFPNYYSQNAWKPAGTHVFPDGNYVFRVQPPSGTETLQVLACLQPLSVPLGTASDPYPLLGPDPQSGRAQVLGLIPETCSACCVTAWTTFQILPAATGYPCPPCWIGPCPPCYGIWPGMCWYYDPNANSWQIVIGECPKSGWCWCLGADGQWHFQINICFGNCP
jgi:hypothetical protein